MKAERRFPAESTSVREARQFVAETLCEFPMSFVEDIVLLVSELATNSVTHGQSAFTLRLEPELHTVRIEITDDDGELPRKRSPLMDEPYGRGLHIVDALAESWGVGLSTEGGKTIWVVVPLPVVANAQAPGAATTTALRPPGVDDLIPRWLLMLPAASAVVLLVATGALRAAGAAVFVLTLLLVTYRLRLGVRQLRGEAASQSELRRRAERIASQAESVLALGAVLATADSVREVAEAALHEINIPTPPTFASVAVVEHNHLRVIASRGDSVDLVDELERIDLARSAWLAAVLSGEPAYVEDRAEFAARYPSALVLQLYDSGSWLVSPFRAEDTLGLLSLHFAEPQLLKEYRLYFSLVSELLGTSLERARWEENQRRQHRELEQAFAERDRIARTLSTSLLPPVLPRIAGFAAAGWLVPASGDEVAGDFYDLFAVEDGWVGVLGDVCGKGAEAAAVTSLARYASRAAALENPDPAHIARVANQALVAEPSDLFCTAAIAHYDRDAGCVDVTLAGHLQARMVLDGEVQRLGRFGAALGLATDSPCVERYPMVPGAMVVLFSDGLVERDPGFGERDLDRFLSETKGYDAARLSSELRALVRRLTPRHPDDIAVLVLERTS